MILLMFASLHDTAGSLESYSSDDLHDQKTDVALSGRPILNVYCTYGDADDFGTG
jgi:hypothetical protein